MTRPVTHIARLLKWGRILARHGALRGIETAPQTPPGVKRLCRIARLGTIQPKMPPSGGGLKQADIDKIRLWIDAGAKVDTVPEPATKGGRKAAPKPSVPVVVASAAPIGKVIKACQSFVTAKKIQRGQLEQLWLIIQHRMAGGR